MPELLGNDLYLQFIIVISCTIEVFFSNILFNLRGKYKKKWWLYTLIAAAVFLCLSVPLAKLRLLLGFNRILQGIFHSLYMLFLNMLLLWITYQEQKFQFLQTLCATHATRIFAAMSLGSLLNLCGFDTSQTMFFFRTENTYLDWALYYLFHIVIYVVFGFLFKEKEDVNLSKKGKVLISILILASLLCTDVVSSVMTPYSSTSWMLSGLIKLLICVFALMILLIRKGIFYTSRKDLEVEMMNNLLVKEREQFEKSRENIDVINAKCHDLRHQLSNLEGKITSEELQSLKQATEFYDSTIKTGNDVLDSILYEYQLSCQNHHIRMTCMMDGKLLSFMDPSDLYSLLANALSNAIRALSEVDEENRVLSITLEEKSGIKLLEIDNYYKGDCRFDDKGLPLSDKDDGRNHGFGSRSISYIVRKYSGTLSYKTDDGIFRMMISF